MDNDQLVQLLTNVVQGMQNQAKEVEDLKKQVGQMAEFMGQFSREQGKLPSSTNVNPNGGFESAKAITFHPLSGVDLGMSDSIPTSFPLRKMMALADSNPPFGFTFVELGNLPCSLLNCPMNSAICPTCFFKSSTSLA
ncbi:hypothetical protein ACFXTO_025780 [Malus domestica]